MIFSPCWEKIEDDKFILSVFMTCKSVHQQQKLRRSWVLSSDLRWKVKLWKWGSFWFWWCSWSNKKIHANKVTGCFLLQIIKHPTLGVWGGLLQHLFSLAKQNNLKGRQGENGNKNRSFISDKNWKLIIYILRQMGISILNLSIWCPWPHSQEMLGDFRSPHPGLGSSSARHRSSV